MTGRIVEVAQDDRHLCKDRGFFVVRTKGEEAGRIPLDAIGTVIASSHGLTCSNNLLVALAERSIPLIVCDRGYRPAAIMWPVVTHHRQAERLEAQVAASTPKKKRLWQQIIQAKIRFQGQALKMLGLDDRKVSLLTKKVGSGDTTNVEAMAARIYFPLLFGKGFRRERDEAGLNALLNYGYMVLRGATARAVMAAGLNPSFPIHHKNLNNPLRLVDDLMEPFRPVVDLHAFALARKGILEVKPDSKKELAKACEADMEGQQGVSPVSECLKNLANSLAQALMDPRLQLELPQKIKPLNLSPSQKIGG